MFKYIIFCLFTSLNLYSMNIELEKFFSIVHNNIMDLKTIVSELKKIRDDNEYADAFVSNFGGKSYNPEMEFNTRKFTDSVMDGVKEAARLIGMEKRKEGALEYGSIENLLIAKRFLEFSQSYNGNYGLVDNDVSSSFVLDQINGMINSRKQYIDVIEKNRSDIERKRKIKSQPIEIPDELLGEF